MSEDSEKNFRRNLVGYCSVVCAGVFLGVQAEAVIKALFKIEVSSAFPERLLLVQFVVFVYLVHRYYFASTELAPWKRLWDNFVHLRSLEKYRYVELQIDRWEKSRKWPNGLSHSQQELVDYMNSRRIDGPVATKSTLNVEMSSTEDSLWTYDINARLSSKPDGAPQPYQDALHIKFTHTRLAKLGIYTRCWLNTIFASKETTETIVPVLACLAATVALLVKWLCPSLLII